MSSDTTKIASTGILKNLAIPATDLPLRFIKVCGLQKTPHCDVCPHTPCPDFQAQQLT
jgi:hypothetical protein